MIITCSRSAACGYCLSACLGVCALSAAGPRPGSTPHGVTPSNVAIVIAIASPDIMRHEEEAPQDSGADLPEAYPVRDSVDRYRVAYISPRW